MGAPAGIADALYCWVVVEIDHTDRDYVVTAVHTFHFASPSLSSWASVSLNLCISFCLYESCPGNDTVAGKKKKGASYAPALSLGNLGKSVILFSFLSSLASTFLFTFTTRNLVRCP